MPNMEAHLSTFSSVTFLAFFLCVCIERINVSFVTHKGIP